MGSLFVLGDEVPSIAQQDPPLPTGGHEPDVVECHPPAPGPAAQFPAQQPAWSDSLSRTDDLDIVLPAPLEIATQLVQVTGGIAHLLPAALTVTTAVTATPPLLR
jgi:hypothetical protein